MISRRAFLRLSTAGAVTSAFVDGPAAQADENGELAPGGADYSHLSGTERESVPTICALCASRCPAVGYVENGILVKIEGHPQSIRTAGKLCAKGQAGINQIYDPDRILQPLRRTGGRGEGKWQRISWDAALGELAGRLRRLREDGHPERFAFHHGWISASAQKLINERFLASYGTATIAENSCLGQSARRTAHELTWGPYEDNWDIDNTRFILNFGSNVLEAHTNHVALAHRLSDGLVDRGVEMVTFDVRLSNTAAKSREWIKIRPGTDLAVVLAMCHVVMHEELYRGEGAAFLAFCQVTADPQASITERVAGLKDHLAPYTPDWAEAISGVNAARIRAVAVEFATAKPACVISSRGASATYNGVDTERAIQMLAAITGNIDRPGTRCLGVTPEWVYPGAPENAPAPRKLDILAGLDGDIALPDQGIGHQVLKMIRDGRAGRPDVYMWYNYNPVLSNANVQENIDILTDESLIPFTVSVTPFYDESAALADLILPDTTYLEQYDCEYGISPSQIPEYAIRQPVVAPQGKARDFKDVCCELAERLELDLGFTSGEEFVQQVCDATPGVADKADGFEGMKELGVWHDPEASPRYRSFEKAVGVDATGADGVIYDRATGVYWNWKTAGLANEHDARSNGYRKSPGANRGYVAQGFGALAYAGFPPGKYNKTGLLELYSEILGATGHAPLPTYEPVPEHQEMKTEDLILTTFRVNVQTLSRTQNCMWLDEILVESPAWIHPETAATREISDGDRIRIKSPLGEIQVPAKVTQGVVPGIVAMSSHGGRWQYGRYASGKHAPYGIADDAPYEDLKWWSHHGTHPNRIISNSAEPVSGQQRWMDTVVSVSKA